MGWIQRIGIPPKCYFRQRRGSNTDDAVGELAGTKNTQVARFPPLYHNESLIQFLSVPNPGEL